MVGSEAIELTTPPSSLLQAARGDLRSRLPPAQARLVELLDVSNFMSCETVLRRQRAAGRLVVSRSQAEDVLDAMRAAGLHAERSVYDLVARDESVEGTHHAGGLVNRDSHPEGQPVVHLACREDLLSGLSVVEVSNEHRLMGGMFGYPDCCVDHYESLDADSPHDRTAASARVGEGPAPRLLNPLLGPLYGIHLLWHFPCSFHCAESRRLADERLRLLRDLAPSTRDLAEAGAGIAFYGPEVGVALATAFRPLSPGRFELHRITTRSETSRRLFSRLSDAVLEVLSPHHFRLGDREFDSPLGFVARFA